MRASSSAGSAFRSRSARSPASKRAVPAAAIMAALSVHSTGGGMYKVRPCSVRLGAPGWRAERCWPPPRPSGQHASRRAPPPHARSCARASHDRGLERRGHVGHLRVRERSLALGVERHRGLDSAEREVRRLIGHVGQRERHRAGIAAPGDPLDGRATRESRGRGAWPPCQRLRPPRRRGSAPTRMYRRGSGA